MTIRGPLAGLKVQMKERRKQNGSDHNGKWEGRNSERPRPLRASALQLFRGFVQHAPWERRECHTRRPRPQTQVRVADREGSYTMCDKEFSSKLRH